MLLSAELFSPAPLIHLCLSWHKDIVLLHWKLGAERQRAPWPLLAQLHSVADKVAFFSWHLALICLDRISLLPEFPLRVRFQAYHSPFLLQGPLTEKLVPQPCSQLLWTHSPCCSYCLMTSWAPLSAGSFLIPGLSHFLQWNARTYFLAVSC